MAFKPLRTLNFGGEDTYYLAPDFNNVENSPFIGGGTTEELFYSETCNEYSWERGEGGLGFDMTPLIIGNEYIVTINGVEYTVTAVPYTVWDEYEAVSLFVDLGDGDYWRIFYSEAVDIVDCFGGNTVYHPSSDFTSINEDDFFDLISHSLKIEHKEQSLSEKVDMIIAVLSEKGLLTN